MIKLVRIVRSLDDLSSIEVKKEPENCPIALKEIKITKSALEKLFLMADAVNDHLGGMYEVYCLLLGDDGVIEDIFIPKQEAGTASVNVSEDNLINIIEELSNMETDKKVIGWGHSHGNFSVFSSSTDDDNHITLLNQTSNYIEKNKQDIKFAYGLTVNIKKDKFGIVISQYTCGAVFQRKGFFTVLEEDKEFNKEEEYKNIFNTVQDKVERIQWRYRHYKRSKFDDLYDYRYDFEFPEIGADLNLDEDHEELFTNFRSSNGKSHFNFIDLYRLQAILSSERMTDELLNSNMLKLMAKEYGFEKFKKSLYSIVKKIRKDILDEIRNTIS